jgi:site-specific recombinase XerD
MASPRDTRQQGENSKGHQPERVTEVLREHMALQTAEMALAGRPQSPWLFTTPAGDMIRSNNFRERCWRPLLASLGLRYHTVHAIRHSYATRMIMAGANVVYLQRQLGHSSIKLTIDLYCHWIELAQRPETLEVDRLVSTPAGTPGGSSAAVTR